MKKITTLIFALLAAYTAVAKAPETTHRVMSCNIRIAGLEADEIDGRRWDDRKEICLKTIKSRKPDIVCMQEVIYESYDWLKDEMDGYYAFGFEGPEMDPYTEGYHYIGKNVIFFSKKRYDFVSAGCYWLSEQPQIGGSLSWGSARARHCNWVRLRDKKTGKEFRVLDAHLDHISEDARQAQAKMLVEEMGQYAPDFTQLLFGDFNSGIANVAIQTIKAAGYKDVWEDINGEVEHGFTCHGWKFDRKKGRRIDFIFHTPDVQTLSAEIVTDHPDDIYPSDHYFVFSEVQF